MIPRHSILIFALSAGIVMCSCQPSVRRDDSSAVYLRQSSEPANRLSKLSPASEQTTKERIVSSSIAIELAVENEDTTTARIKSSAVTAGGYIVSTTSASVIFRVPAAETDRFITFLAGIGDIRSKSMSGQDVTEEYYDIQTRLENAESARKRYLELLAKAENVEATLKVERELERLNGEIETMKGKIARMKELSSMTTISVNYTSKTTPGPIGYVFVYLFKGIRWLFVWD